MSDEVSDRDLLDQTLYFASRIYECNDTPIPLDLHSACAIGDYKCVQDSIADGADINARNKAGWTPLMYASYVGHDTIVNLLLDSKVESSKGTPTGLTPLMVAAGCGNESVCYFLIQAGSEVDAQDSQGYTALVHALRQGHVTTVQLLLEAGASMELVDHKNGYTALMFAAIEGDEIIVDILVACGADLKAEDKKGRNARQLAFSSNNVRIVTLLDNAVYMYRPLSETPTNEIIIEEPPEDKREEESDLFSGAKEMEAYKQESLAVKRDIQMNLGRRSGPRWSLPHQNSLSFDRRFSSSDSKVLLGLKEKKLKSALSMPEQDNPPPAAVSPEPTSMPDPKMVEFLTDLGLEKYVTVLHEKEIDFQALINFTDEDLKGVGIKLMGPRRKLTQAISDLKDQKVDSGHGSGSNQRKTSRPLLKKQSTTDVTEAYREAMDTISTLEEQVSREHQLRKTADNFLLELQSSRQQAVSSVAAIKDNHADISKHCNAIKSTHQKLSDELDGLRSLSNSTIEPHQLQRLYSELVSLKSRMGMELEALSRSIDSTAELTNTLCFHLKTNS